MQPIVSDPKHYIPEGRTVISTDLNTADHKQSKETSGFCQIHATPFQFIYQQSHRTVTPNLFISSSPSSDCSDLMPNTVRTPFLGIGVLHTDLDSVIPVPSELCSNPELSTNSQLSTEKQCFKTFYHVISEFEETVPTLSTDDPVLVSSKICPMETALAPSSSEISQSPNESLMDVDLKAKPRPVHADSLESDTEYFDCQQTFSEVSEQEVSEQELRSEELPDSETVYHVEESPSLPDTPAYDYLFVMPKISEKSDLDSQDSPRPVSWTSEEIDLPIVLEPEDECVGEHDEQIAYPYGYAFEHSYAEELPPRQGCQYDEDDDSLGRVSHRA